MRNKEKVQTQRNVLHEGRSLIFSRESSLATGSSRLSSCSSSSSSSYSSSNRSRSPSVECRSQRRLHQGSRFSSSSSSNSSSRSRSRPRCCRGSGETRCRQRHRSRSYSPYSMRSYRYGQRRYSHSSSRSSSRERYYGRSRRCRSRSTSYRSANRGYIGRSRLRFSTSPVRRYYRSRSRSPERSILLSQKDKMELLNIANENAAKILGVDVKLPFTLPCMEEEGRKALESDTKKRARGDPVMPSTLSPNKGKSDEDCEISRTSPGRKPISFNFSFTLSKPSSSPKLRESKVTSRADSVGNRRPYGQWIPVKTVSTKKRLS